MKNHKAWSLAALILLGGCAAQQSNPYPDVASLLNAPPPRNHDELTLLCTHLRQEMKMQRTKENIASVAIPGTTLMSAQDEATHNFDALKAKSDKLGCDEVPDEQEKPAEAHKSGDYIDMCMAKCKQYTSRTPEQCFDACK